MNDFILFILCTLYVCRYSGIGSLFNIVFHICASVHVRVWMALHVCMQKVCVRVFLNKQSDDLNTKFSFQHESGNSRFIFVL